MEQITSLKNEYIKELCRLKTVAGRKDTGLFMIEGIKLCREALSAGWEIEKCLATESQISFFLDTGLESKTVCISEGVSDKLSSMETSPGCFMVLRQQSVLPSSDNSRFILALDHLSDPANLGAILRSAEAFKADYVYLSEGSVDLYSIKVLRAAMGSAFRMPVQKGDLLTFLKQKKEEGYQILGAGLNRRYCDLTHIDFQTPTVVVIGNEANGICEEVMNICTQGLFIPMLGANESLNAAVAASIILWEQSKWR